MYDDVHRPSAMAQSGGVKIDVVRYLMRSFYIRGFLSCHLYDFNL